MNYIIRFFICKVFFYIYKRLPFFNREHHLYTNLLDFINSFAHNITCEVKTMNNIKEFRKKAGLSQFELAELCGVHQTAVSQWEQGRTNPDTDTLVALSHIFHTSLGSILGLDSPDDPVMISVKGLVYNGEITFIEDEDVCEFVALSPEFAHGDEFFALRVEGNTMYPSFREDDIIIIHQQTHVDDNEMVVAVESRKKAFLKRIRVQDNGIMLLAENPDYESSFYTNEQMARLPITFLGKAVEMRREIH